MKRLDDGKVSLVEFLQSIRFRQRGKRGQSKQANRSTECPSTHFAPFDPKARPEQQNQNTEEQTLVRSAN